MEYMCSLPALIAGVLLVQNPLVQNPQLQDPVKETVVVTGTYESVPLNEMDRAVAVLPITSRNVLLFDSISDLFKLDAALDLQQRAPNDVQGDLDIRGGTFGQTLVLVDGMRVNDAQSGHHNQDIPVPLDAIQQVEVLQGAGSTQYGSDAIGGVVNVVTRRPQGLEATLRAGLGSFGTNQEALTLGGGTAKYSELLAVSRDFSKGFTEDREYRNLSMSSETMFKDPMGPASVLLALRDSPFGADQFYGDYDSWERTKEWLALAHQNIGDNTELDFGYRRHTDLFVLFWEDPQIYTNRHADETWEGSVRRTDDMPFGGKLHYGTEIDADSIQSNNLGYHSRHEEAVYVDYDLRVLKRFSFSVGLRDDIYSGLKNQLSPNASGAAWLNRHFKLRAAVSRAFRLPTYTDLYYSDPTTLGNPNLKPETAWNYEGGLDWHANSSLEGGLTLFNRHDSNIIDYIQTNPTQPFRAMNVQSIVFTGVEANVKYTLNPRNRFNVSYSLLHGDKTPLPGTVSRYVFNYPTHSAVAAWEGDLPFGLIARTRVGALQRFQASPYAVWDASIGMAKGRVRPYLQLTNITNTGYEDFPNIPQPGRAVIGGVSVKLGKVL
jgi:iron complex outermembrane receptor protein